MVFGLRERFAVESIVYHRSSEYLLGRLRLWIGGSSVGDFAQNLVLATPCLFIRDFLNLPGTRNHFSLADKTKEDVLTIVHWVRYSDGEDSVEEQAHLQYREFADAYKKCELCPVLSPSFDGEQAVLLEKDGQERVIWKPFGRDDTQDIVLREGECLSAPRAFTDWVGQSYG